MRNLISTHSDVCHGKPCFVGTRIPIYLVLELLEAGESSGTILKSYPQLTRDHIRAALHFAAETVKNIEYAAFA